MNNNTYIFHNYIIWILVCFGWTMASGQSTFNKDALTSLKIYNEEKINTPNLESSPAFMGDKLAFVYTDVKGKLFDKEIDEPYFNLGFALVNPDNSLDNRMAYNTRINSDLHEGPMSYDPHKNMMFLTRSHKETRKYKGIELDTFYLRILSADLNVSKPVVKPININVANYSVCHPSLNSDGKMMVFSSNKPGGNGKMDLNIAYYNGVEWTGMINAGNLINTTKNEVFPYLLNDSILIFASDREGGLGGLDLYASKLTNGSWEKPELLPEPFNSSFDDLGLVVRENMKSGYFSSNRPGGKGKDDIYRFETSQPIFGENTHGMITTEIQILDKLTLDPVSMSTVTLTPLDIDVNNFTLSSFNIDMLSGRDPGDLILKLSPKKGQSFPEFMSNDEGKASFQINKSQKYLITINSDGYTPLSIIYDYQAFGNQFNMVLEPSDDSSVVTQNTDEYVDDSKDVKTNLDLENIISSSEIGDVIVLENIYYDYNSSQLKQGATKELEALIKAMIVNDNMKIRLEAHTDSRGTAAYNLQLSVDRANAVRNYLVDRGIDEDKITIRGFGESKLRNKCADKVPCSDKEHAYNRRTEVVIEQN